MKAIFTWSSRRPFFALLAALVITLVLATGLPSLTIDASLKPLLSGDDPRVTYLEEVTVNFGHRPYVVALMHSPALFEAATLSRLRDYSDALGKIEGVVEAASIFTTTVLAERGGVIGGARALEKIPDDSGSLLEKQRELLGNSLLRGNFINDKGDALALYLFLEPENAAGRNHEKILSRMHEVREEYATLLPGTVELKFIGIPVTKASVWESIRMDLTVLGPIALVVISILIFLFYRSAGAVCIPFLTGLFSAIATLGFMGHAGFAINVFLSIIVVLILVLGCTEDLHILSEYRKEIESGSAKLDAIANIGIASGRAFFLSAATTSLSFLSIAFTEVTGLRNFAVSCAFGMAVNFLITILVAPAMLALLPQPTARSGGMIAGLLAGLERKVNVLVTSHRKTLYVTFAVFLAVLGLGAFRMEIDTNYLNFSPKDSDVIETHDYFSRHFGGACFLMITCETGEKRGVFKPENLAAICRFHEFLEKEYGATFGYLNFLQEHRALREAVPLSPGEVPDHDEVAAMISSVPARVLDKFIDFDRSRIITRLKFDPPGSKDTMELESRIEAFAKEHLPPTMKVRLTGEKAVIDQLSDLVTRHIFANLSVLCLFSALLIALFLRSLRQGLLSILPNLFPVAAIFGGMGWLGIPLSLGTCPVAIVAFGVAVDDTIHFFVRYNTERGLGISVRDAVSRSIHREFHPVIATSVTLIGGFLVIVLSPSPVNREVGVLFIIGAVAALIAELFLTPLLLGSRLNRSRRESDRTNFSSPV
jgi:uncharacterized protein